MDLIKCPVCGEKYSSSYRRCPFCEEEDRPRKVSGKRRGGHHVAERKHTHSARGPLIAVLLVVLVIFSWYLFGDAHGRSRGADGRDERRHDAEEGRQRPLRLHDPNERFHSAHSARH